MAPTLPAKKMKAAQSKRRPATSDDDDDFEGVDVEERGPDPLKTAQDMLEMSRKRREAKREVIKSEWSDRVEKTRSKIQTFYEDRKSKVTKAQNQKWDQLEALLKKRREIEGRIFKSMKIIEQASLNLSHELDAMYAGRMDDIAELDTTGRITSGEEQAF